MNDDSMGLTLDEVAQQVALLSRTMTEIMFWMSEAEKSGSVPEGMTERARDLAYLHRLDRQIRSIRDTLGEEPVDPNDLLRGRLAESLALLGDKADSLRERLEDA
jgi:hypothetical protein